MAIECLECKNKCGLPFKLDFFVIQFVMKIKLVIVHCYKSISGICMKTDCPFNTRNGNSVNPNPNPI